MVKRNAEYYHSLQAIPAPDFSDGDPRRHPYQTIPQRTGPINYYRPCYPEEQKTLAWLSKLGTAVYKNAVHSLPSNVSTPEFHAGSSTPSTSASPLVSSSTALVLASQTLAPRTSLPVAPEIGINPHDEVTYRLVSFPAGYKLFVHTIEVGAGQHYTKTIPKGGGNEGTRNVRYDTYLFGHPSGVRFRSPNEFLPHLWWMINDPKNTDCQCLYCGFILPRRRLAIEAKKPEESPQKQEVDKESVFGAAAVAALVKGAPTFRVGEIVWAKSKKSFIKVPEGEPAGAFLPTVPLWPAVIHNIHRDEGLPTKYETFLLKLHRENSEPRSISVLEERLLPWLAHSPAEPTAKDLLTAAELGIPEFAIYRDALRQARREVQPQYHPFGGYYEPPISEKELRLHLDPATREWMSKQHTFERYKGMWFGTERILCQEVIRMAAASGPEVPSRDPNDRESQYDFFYIRSIFDDPDDGLTIAGDIYRRRRAEHSESTLDGFDGEYVWYQASQKVEEFTVGVCNVAGRYYHQYPNLHLRMEVKEMAPEADRSVALQLGRPLSYLGPEKEGVTYIRKVLCPSRPTSARNQGNSPIETRTQTSNLNSRKRRKPQETADTSKKQAKKSKMWHARLATGAEIDGSHSSDQSEGEASQGGADSISEHSFGNEIEYTIISPAVEREHNQNSTGNGQKKHVSKTNVPLGPISHRPERSNLQTSVHNSHTENLRALYEEQRNGIPLHFNQKGTSTAPKPVAGHQRNSSNGRRSSGVQITDHGSLSHEQQHSIPPSDSPYTDRAESNNIKAEKELDPTSTPLQNAESHDHQYPSPLPPTASTSAPPISTAGSTFLHSSKTTSTANIKTFGVRGDQNGTKTTAKRVIPKGNPPRPDSTRTPAVLKWRGKLRLDNLDACDAIGMPLEKSSSGKLIVSDQQRSLFYAPLLARIPDLLEISMHIPVEHAERYFSKLDQVLTSRNCMCLVLTASRLANDWDKTRVVFGELVQSMKSGGYCGVVKHGGLRMLIKPQDDMLLCLAQFGTDTSSTVTTSSAATDAASEGRRSPNATAESDPSNSLRRTKSGSDYLTQPSKSPTPTATPGATSSPASLGTPIRVVSPPITPETPTSQFTEATVVRSDRFRSSPIIACVNYADQVSGTVDLSECTSLPLLVHAIGLALGYGDAWRNKKPTEVNLRFMGFDRVMWTVVEENIAVHPTRYLGDEKVTRDLDDVRRFALTINTVYEE